MFIDFDGIINFRDLGGIKTTEGRTVHKKCLYRCGELEKASDRDMQRLAQELKIRCVIDFRDPREAEERPDRDVAGAVYRNFPALPPMVQPKDRMKQGSAPDMENIFPGIYRDLAESRESIAAYQNFFRLLLSAEGAPLLWHCRQGKDRTGIAAILLLTALGVSREDCIREYLLTNDYMQPRYELYCRQESDPWKRRMMELITFVREDWLAEYLQIVDERFGGPENYLREVIGLSGDMRQRLKDTYLE